MEEEVGVKVTRLRRRLSIEAEDVKSPSTQSTPTKKRGGRLAAKPQLELIDENATETDKPKRTRKSVGRDVEPEAAVTPSRRSTRIRSNTSIVSETPVETEDKGTPSRRNTRVKSNTSIVAEAIQHVDSPRAKRAARRTSQVGSDNEAPITPARSTRRGRKDSTSSIDKQVELNSGILETQVKEVIFEEAESNVKDSKNKKTPTKDKNETTTTRRSPRLNEKTSSPDTNNKENEIVNELKDEKPDTTNGSTISSSKIIQNNKSPEEINLSMDTSNLINQLNDEPKKGFANLNKTTSAVEGTQSKSKRHRTKSWTTITSSPASDNKFLSDTEAIMKKKNINESGSGDNVLNTSKKFIRKTEEQHDMKDVSLNCSSASDKKKKKRGDKSVLGTETPVKEISVANKLTELDKLTTDEKDLATEIISVQNEEPNFTEKFLGEPPSGAIQSVVYIDDSDSNTGSGEKGNLIKGIGNGDQCVPVVEHQLNELISKEVKSNLSYEPMDIDETMPENISISVFTDEKNDNSQKRKSFLNISQVNNVSIDSTRKSIILDSGDGKEIVHNKSKRKSEIAATSSDGPIDKHVRKSSLGTENVDDNTDANFKKSSMSITTDDINFPNSNLEDNNMNKSANKSKRKSTNPDNSIYEGSNKSNRKSSISLVDNDSSIMNESKFITDIPDEVDNDESISKCSNKPQRTSIVGNMKTSSLNADSDIGDLVKKSKRKSSLSKVDSDDNVDNNSTINKSFNKSDRMSHASNLVNEDDLIDSINKSNVNDKTENKCSKKNKKTSLVIDAVNDTVSKNADESTRKSSITKIIDNDEADEIFTEFDNEDITNQSSEKLKRKSSILNNNHNKKQEITNNCKRISSISNLDVEESIKSNKNRNKSNRKSSISQMESQIFDKSSENKSTLILSQIKNMSETSLPKDVNESNVSDDSNEQLSKSMNVPNIMKDKDSNKKNLSLTYSTSTPLQQKSLKKLGMQMNSSIITPDSSNKMENKNYLNRSKKETSVVSQNDEASEPSDEEDENISDDDDEECSEDDSIDNSNMIENEADEASDDYESGDSRDEDERKYEEEHEIIAKGETLDSEDEDFSDDSEYEKGSFIVDSDEEDADLLSGSSDDLSMSANELDMSAKSKKKFNERKIKEQKQASREMFEARHKLNKSDNSAKSERCKSKKKVNRQRLESSESESDEDVGFATRKNRRARIDSSQDISMAVSDSDKSILKQKKNLSKRFSESSTNEKEISIHENLEIEKEDPLSLQNMIKEEPKTPPKDFNVSTVSIVNLEEVEKVDVESNASIMKSNQVTDPLQVTMTQEEVMDDASEESISENEEITQNYEHVLNDLNKKSKKVKSMDLSLNLSKKTKQKTKEPIVDQLNLTQVKKSKKTKKDASQKTDSNKVQKDIKDKSFNSKTMEKDNKAVSIQEEGSSDSIDMKLLFNEDSTDGEIKVSTEKGNTKVVEEFIPLKKTEGKTNILESNDVTNGESNESMLNVSKSKKNKRKSSTVVDDHENGNLNFFIDTTGTYDDMNESVNNTSTKGSTKKNKQKKNNVSTTNIEDANHDNDSNDAPIEISYRSDKNINKSKQDLNISQTGEKETVATDSKTPSSAKKNKKKKKGLDNSQINVELADNDSNDAPIEISYRSDRNIDKSKQDLNISQSGEKETVTTDSKTPTSGKKNKKKKKGLDNSQINVEFADEDTNLSVGSVTNSNKKKKNKTVASDIEKAEVNADIVVEETPKKRKRKPSANHSIEEIIPKDDVNALNASKTLIDTIIITNQKKKRKISHTVSNENMETKKPDAVSQTKKHDEKRLPDEPKPKRKNMLEPKHVQSDELTEPSKKRKERDDDVDGEKLSKVVKQNYFDKVHVPRLPTNVLRQLDDKPKKHESRQQTISTTSFKVEATRQKRSKPSNYLEQSVYLNDSIEEQTRKQTVKTPKVLPFIPTASTSDCGFTTKFRVNVIPQVQQFVAQSKDMSNFKNDYLQKTRVKKLGTFEKYKRHRNVKISKF